MLTLILLATCVPILTVIAYVAMRNRCPQLVADVRGIALQTVIIIVVLLAIAGAVAGVLVTRGGQAVDQLEAQNPSTRLTSTAFNTADKCRNAGFHWDLGDDNAPGGTGANADACYTSPPG